MRDKPLVIGICGRARHGKDAIAVVLGELFSARRLAFADHLKHLAMQTWDLSWDQVYGDLKEVGDPRWGGLTPRFLLQRMGTEVGRNIHKETWVRKAFDTIDRAYLGETVTLPNFTFRRFEKTAFPSGSASLWSVPDVRFKDEAEAVQARGGFVIKVVRPGLARPTDTHASETNIDEVREDYLVTNDGTIEDLAEKVEAIVGSVLRPKLEDTIDPASQAALLGRKP